MKADIAAAKEKKKKATAQKSSKVVDEEVKSEVTPLLEEKDEEAIEQEEDLLQDGNVNLLVEVVSAADLPIADVSSTDPYVVVFMGKQEVHRTKKVFKR